MEVELGGGVSNTAHTTHGGRRMQHGLPRLLASSAKVIHVQGWLLLRLHVVHALNRDSVLLEGLLGHLSLTFTS